MRREWEKGCGNVMIILMRVWDENRVVFVSMTKLCEFVQCDYSMNGTHRQSSECRTQSSDHGQTPALCSVGLGFESLPRDWIS